MVSIPFTAVYLVEMLIVLFTSDGATIIREKKLYILEFVCQVCSIYGYVLMYSQGSQQDFANGASLLLFGFLVRNLRISILL